MVMSKVQSLIYAIQPGNRFEYMYYTNVIVIEYKNCVIITLHTAMTFWV